MEEYIWNENALESENPDHKDQDRVFRQICFQPASKICHKLQVLSSFYSNVKT